MFTPEAANATAYSNSVIGTNTWQWWNKERGEWAVYAITVTGRQPSEELPPLAPTASPVPSPAKHEPQSTQPERPEATEAEAATAQQASAPAPTVVDTVQQPVHVEAQPQPPPQMQPPEDASATPPATDAADQELPAQKASLTVEQTAAAVSPEESVASDPREPVNAG